ncbi:3-dehydroquinate synthase [Flavimarina sp. Hel_I_48]|uniref:3-dehydroquinate synthase n=1 Tax=Flavimarina sp. Hel_I_48 TaxID=1392488 RepID=UPI0004DF8070|nr:3-dehydroquinate synthase [Flavimarina sp. Hel_I_48]
MSIIAAKDYPIVLKEKGYTLLNEHLLTSKYSTLFILVDSNTHEHCLAHFLSNLETGVTIEIIEIDAGEDFKNIETCSGVWAALSELNGDRKSLMINVGGGVVTDLGGFVACTFKRGIDYVNVPTSLLAMVDASVGGKTGVDLGTLKNQIGVISNPKMVLVDPWFLGSLSLMELRSGYAEMLKHGLIADYSYWLDLNTNRYDNLDSVSQLIERSIEIKNSIVLEDPREHNVRKTLNYGHTLGHAIESYFMEKGSNHRLLHGEAIAIGMILASFISKEISGLPNEQLNEITKGILQYYDKVTFTQEDIEAILELLIYDKKNSHGQIYFVLLKKIGEPLTDQKVTNDTIYGAFDFYKSFSK